MGCRRRASQEELVRVVATAGGTPEVGRRLPGRGAWLCAGSETCVDAALRRGALAKALRVELADDAAERLHVLIACVGASGRVGGCEAAPGRDGPERKD